MSAIYTPVRDNNLDQIFLLLKQILINFAVESLTN